MDLQGVLKMRGLRSLVFAMLFLTSCQTHQHGSTFAGAEDSSCRKISGNIDWNDAVRALNTVSILFRNECWSETTVQIEKAREVLSHKTWSIVKEGIEFFIPEGKVTDYVLESYERGYLSFVAAAAWMRKSPTPERSVMVELNRLYNEETAQTYNHGRDPVNALLQAAMWDNFAGNGFSSRPFWYWVSKHKAVESPVRKFARDQVRRLDERLEGIKWKVYEIGEFPRLDWDLTLTDAEHGYFRVKAKRPFKDACVTDHAVLISTRSWFQKIAMRHSKTYHPLVNAKSWIRAPFGLAYGVTTLAAGAGIMVGGCAVDIGMEGDGTLCQLSVRSGYAVAAKTDDVIDYALQPDLRHWERVPEAVLILRDGVDLRGNSSCSGDVHPDDVRRIF